MGTEISLLLLIIVAGDGLHWRDKIGCARDEPALAGIKARSGKCLSVAIQHSIIARYVLSFQQS